MNVIIKGHVHTSEGPIPVEELEVGDLIVDRGHRARKLIDIETVEINGTLQFKRNTEPQFGSDTVLKTLVGRRTPDDGEEVVFLLPNGQIVYDTAEVADETVTGYVLTVENGSDLYVDGYSMEVES